MMALRLLVGSGSMDYTSFMKFEWDEAKSDACFLQRGFEWYENRPNDD
jgi:hypothetical protein